MKKILILSTSKLTTGAIFHINQCLKSLNNIENVKVYLILNSHINFDLHENLEIELKIIKSCKNSFINILFIFFFIPFYSYLKRIDVIYCP